MLVAEVAGRFEALDDDQQSEQDAEVVDVDLRGYFGQRPITASEQSEVVDGQSQQQRPDHAEIEGDGVFLEAFEHAQSAPHADPPDDEQ